MYIFFFKCYFCNGFFNMFNGYWWLIDVQYIGCFIGSGVYVACEFWEVIGVVQDFIGQLLVFFVYGIIEFWDDIVQGVVIMVKWYVVVYIVGCLFNGFFFFKVFV